ncbi:MAG: hypothetical protein WBH31_12340 [Promethearchaeia archaeon]
MNRIKSKTKFSLLNFSLLGIIIFGMLSTAVAASINYQSPLTKGTEELMVNTYDNTAWKSTVDPFSTPIDWFGGDANITEAKSKVTLKGFASDTWYTYNVITSYFLPISLNNYQIVVLLNETKNQGYDNDTINALFPNSYNFWYGLSAVWEFTDSNYEEDPSYPEVILVFQNPLDFKTMLDDYNNLSAEFNGNLTLTFSYPIINADEFLWYLVLNGLSGLNGLNGLTIASPQTEYLVSLINGLGCDNASVSGETLIIERYGVTNYTVEISYGSKGKMSSFVVKDVNGNIIYQIVSINSEWIFYMILAIAVAASIGIIVVLFLRSRKIKRA